MRCWYSMTRLAYASVLPLIFSLDQATFLRCECEAPMKFPGHSHLRICRIQVEFNTCKESQDLIHLCLASIYVENSFIYDLLE
jgi:hypothetical protein